MKFVLIDRIVSWERGKTLTAVKSVSLAEEYLADHFPTFPVLPGVLLLQGLIESASWLVRQTEDFAHSMILLKQTRNVRYKSFLAPGSQIEYTVEARAIDESASCFSGYGVTDGEKIVQAHAVDVLRSAVSDRDVDVRAARAPDDIGHITVELRCQTSGVTTIGSHHV